MREVDEALARAFAHREATEPGRGVPPAPHWPASPSTASDRPEPGRGPGPELSAYGEVIARPRTSAKAMTALELQWPSIVLRLEHDWGDRFDQMARRLIEVSRREDRRAILFTSCHRAEGRSTLVLTLARAVARLSRRTAVVDADLTGPMLARLLGLRPELGLDDVVESGHPLADALIDAPDDGLAVLPIRCPVARPREFLSSPAWTSAIARLRREFEVILLDGGPLFTGLGSAVLHRSVDAAVLVLHRGLTGERAILRAREALAAGGVPLLGLAETFV